MENKLHSQTQHWGVGWGEVAISARVSEEGLTEKITFNLKPTGDEERNTADISGMVSRHKEPGYEVHLFLVCLRNEKKGNTVEGED